MPVVPIVAPAVPVAGPVPLPPAALLVGNVPHELPAGRDPSGTASDVFLVIFYAPAFPLGHGVLGQGVLLMAARDVLAMAFPNRLNRISLGGSHKLKSFTFVSQVHPSARTEAGFIRSRGSRPLLGTFCLLAREPAPSAPNSALCGLIRARALPPDHHERKRNGKDGSHQHTPRPITSTIFFQIDRVSLVGLSRCQLQGRILSSDLWESRATK